MPKPYFLDIIGNISTASRVIGNIAGADFSEGEKIVTELDTLYDAVYTLATEKDTLATENEALTRRVRELEAIIRDHVPFADHLLEPASDEPEPVQPLDTGSEAP